jgi:hypothetical protein
MWNPCADFWYQPKAFPGTRDAGASVEAAVGIKSYLIPIRSNWTRNILERLFPCRLAGRPREPPARAGQDARVLDLRSQTCSAP